MILGKVRRQPIILKINQIKVKEFQKAVLLCLTIDDRLTLKDHVNMLCSAKDIPLISLSY